MQEENNRNQSATNLLFFLGRYSLVGYLTGLFLFFFGAYLFLFPKYLLLYQGGSLNLSAQKNLVVYKQNRLEKMKAALADFSQFSESDKEKLYQFFPRTASEASVVVELAEIAKENHVRLIGVNFKILEADVSYKKQTSTFVSPEKEIKEEPQKANLIPLQIEANFSGTDLQGFQNLLQSFENNLRILEVQGFSYQPNGQQYGIKLKSFFMNESSSLAENIQPIQSDFFYSQIVIPRISRSNLAFALQQSVTPLEKYHAPKGVKAYDPGSGRDAVLVWERVGEEVERIHIYQSNSKGEKGEERANVSKEATYFQDHELKEGVSYYYTLESSAKEKEPIASEQVLVRPLDILPPSPILDLLFSQKEKKIEFQWKNPKDVDFSGVRIYRSEKKGELGELQAELNSESFSDTLPNLTSQYYYTFTSVDKNGNESVKVFLDTSAEKKLSTFDVNNTPLPRED